MGSFIGKMTTIREHFHKEELCYSWTENLKATIHPKLDLCFKLSFYYHQYDLATLL